MRIKVTTSSKAEEVLGSPGEYHIVLVQGERSKRCFVYVWRREEFVVLSEELGFSWQGPGYNHFFFIFRDLYHPWTKPMPQEVLDKLRQIFAEEEVATVEGGIFVDSDIEGVK